MAVQASQLTAEVSAIGVEETQSQFAAMDETVSAAAATFTEIENAVSSGSAALASVGEEASADSSGLSELGSAATDVTDILRGLAAIIDTLESGFGTLDTSLSEVATNTAETASSLSEADTAADTTVTTFNYLNAILETLQSGFASLDESMAQMAADVSDSSASLQEMTGSMQDLVDASDSAAAATAEVGASASEAGGGLGGLLGTVGEAATSVGMFVISAQATVGILGQMQDALVGADASMEQTQVAFTTLTGSASAAQAEITSLVNFAATTPFHEAGIEQAAESMLAFGFKSKEVIPDLTAIGDVLSGLGRASDASLGSIVDIFGKIQAAGKLSGGEMMQMTRWGIPAWQILSKEMGKPIPILQDMVKKGMIPAKTAIDDLTHGIEHNPLFAGGMAKQAQTFNGLMSTLQDNLTTAWRAFTGPLFDQAKGALEQLGNIVSSKGFQQWAKDMGKDVGAGITAIVGFVKNDLIPAFQSISKWIDTNKPTFIAIWSEVLKVLPQVWSALQQVGDFLITVFTPVWQQLVNTFNEQLKPAWDDFMKALGPAMPALKLIAEVIGGAIVVALIVLVTWWSMLAQAIIWVVGIVVRFVGMMVDSWLNFLSTTTTIVNGIIAIWNGLPAWWNNLLLQSAVWGINLVNSILRGLQSAWSNVTTWFTNALNWIKGLFPHSPVEHGPLQGIENWGKNITNMLASGIKGGIPQVQAAFNSLTGPSFNAAYAGSGVGSYANQPFQQNITLMLDGHVLTQAVMTRAARQVYIGTGVRRPA